MTASAVRSNAACANIGIQMRPVTAKIAQPRRESIDRGARARTEPYYGCSRIGVPGQVLGTMRAPPIPVRASVGSIRSMPECALKNPILGHSFTK